MGMSEQVRVQREYVEKTISKLIGTKFDGYMQRASGVSIRLSDGGSGVYPKPWKLILLGGGYCKPNMRITIKDGWEEKLLPKLQELEATYARHDRVRDAQNARREAYNEQMQSKLDKVKELLDEIPSHVSLSHTRLSVDTELLSAEQIAELIRMVSLPSWVR